MLRPELGWPRSPGTASGGRCRADGTRVRLPTTKGLHYLAELIAHPGAERHVLDLVDRVEGVGGVDRRRLGDAGEVLDGRARTAYRHRIETAAGRGRGGAGGRVCWKPPSRSRTSSIASSPSSPRRSASAGAIGVRRRPPSGPGSTSPGRCGRPSPSSSTPSRRQAAVLDRRVRTGLVLRLRARRRRRGALDRSVLSERDRRRLNATGHGTNATHCQRDRRRHLPHLHLRAPRWARRVHVQPVPRRCRRAAAVPHRRRGGCSRSSPRPWPPSCRSSRCAGSRSATSKPTSAGR